MKHHVQLCYKHTNSYHCILYHWAKEGTQPHGWQRREVAAKVTVKNGYFPQFSTCPMLQDHLYILFSKTPDFGF